MTGEVTEVLARAVSPIFSLITAIVTYSLANTMYKSKGLAKSALFFLTTVPVFMFVSEECLSDIVTAFIHLSSIYFLHMSLEKDQPGSRRLMFVAGLMAGASAFTKYDGLVSLIIGWALIILYKHLDRTGQPQLDNDQAIVGVHSISHWCSLLGSWFLTPWYVRSLVLLGNQSILCTGYSVEKSISGSW
jgi:4-amino-4-deoxy-L-arabinose transferase-like glycosyltransferase